MTDIREQQKIKTIGDLIAESNLGAALAVLNEHGYNSDEFKQAEIDYQKKQMLENRRG